MSSTNRSNAREEHVADYYITPVDEIVKFLNEFKKIEPNMNRMLIVDPCGGGDETHPMSYPEAFKQVGISKKIWTIDIRENSLADKKTNYLTLQMTKAPDMIITNPPFNIAIDIIQKALNDVKDNGWVIMLQKLNFMGSKDRFGFWKENMPEYIYVHHKRMSFTGKGTDSIEYCHYVWRKGYNPGFSKIIII